MTPRSFCNRKSSHHKLRHCCCLTAEPNLPWALKQSHYRRTEGLLSLPVCGLQEFLDDDFEGRGQTVGAGLLLVLCSVCGFIRCLSQRREGLTEKQTVNLHSPRCLRATASDGPNSGAKSLFPPLELFQASSRTQKLIQARWHKRVTTSAPSLKT